MAGEVDQLLVRIDATTEQLRRELQRAERSISGFERNAERNAAAVETRFQRMSAGIARSVGGIGAAIGGIAIGREILGTITQFERLDQRIKTLTGTSAAYDEAQGYLRETSNRLATDLAATTDQYASLLTLQNSGLITNQQARALLEGFADAAAATGAETAQLNQVMYGLSQALSSGTVRAEEFNQVTEPMPGLLQAMEKAAGVSAGGLRKLVNEGEVTSEMFGRIMVDALQTFAGEAEKRADTLGGKWQILNNQWTELQRALSEPVTDVLAPLLGTATDFLNKIAPIVDGLAKIEAFGRRFRRAPAEVLGLVEPYEETERARLQEERSTVQEMIKARRAPGGPFAGEPGADAGLAKLQKRLQLIDAQLVALDGRFYGPDLPMQGPNLPPPLPSTPPPGEGDEAARKKAAREAEIARKRAEREAEQDTGAIAKLTDELALLEAVNEEERIRLERSQAVAAAGQNINNPQLKPIAEDLAGQIFDAQRALEAAQKVAEEGKAIYDATRTATEEYAARVQRLNELLMQGAISQEAFGRATQQAKEELAKATAGTNELEKAILGGLQHAIVSIGGDFKNLEQVAVAAISHIVTELIRMQQVASASGKKGPLSGLFDILGSAVGGIFGGGGAGVFGFGGGMVPDAAAAGIPGGGFAMGGRPPVGIASLVGERGPEVFVPDVAGTVVPNFAIKPQGSAGGPQAVNYYTVDARGANDPGAVQMAVARGIAAATPGIVRQSTAATRNRFTRERLIPVR